MRRFVILNFLVLSLSSVGLFSCNTVSERPISQSDIPDLIGKWEGNYDAGMHTELVTMQILNDSLEGRISFQNPQFGFPSTVGGAFTGKIENGRLAASWDKDCWINIMKLRKDGGKMKLEGNIQTSARKGSLTLEKNK
jgi:hypothetical protein